MAEAELELQKLRTKLESRTKSIDDLVKRKVAAEERVEVEVLTGEASAEASVTLSALEKALKKAEIEASEERAAISAAERIVSALQDAYQRASLKWKIHDPEGPAARANALIEGYIEALPAVVAQSVELYHEATQLGWKPGHQWQYGPAGALIEILQNLKWPTWPHSFRPSWAPLNGVRPKVNEIVIDYLRMFREVASANEALASGDAAVSAPVESMGEAA
ncbi:hypothetical protein SLG_17510 [Sphingobium sp. SYK-6]|nr:hypothetical protein SLG_17510 [Sphingobium sp. SYK-6]